MGVEHVGANQGVVVVKMDDRRFPGIVIQGDTLLSLLQDLEEESPNAVATATVRGWLEAYEHVLDEKAIDLPYPRRPHSDH